MLSLSDISLKTNESNKEILDNIKYKKYYDFIEINSKEKITKIIGTSGNKEIFEKTQEQFKSKKFIKLANYYFKEENLKNLILDKNGNINKKLTEKISGGENRLKEILKQSKNGTDWGKNTLYIEEIALLYSESFNFLKLPNLKEMTKTGLTRFKGFISGLVVDKSKTEEIKSDFVSENILISFSKKGIKNFGGNNMIKLENDNEIENNLLTNHNEKDKEQLKEIIDFKNKILESGFLSQVFEDGDNRKEIFKDNLDYRWIIGLYSLMGGNLDFKNQNAVNKLSIVYLNSKVLGVYEGSLYLGKLLLNYIKDEDSIFTEEELKILGIYKDKMLDIGIMYNLSEIGKKLGFAEGLTDTDLNKLALSLGGGGTLSYLIGNKLIAKGIEKKKLSILGGIFKKVGIIGIISGLAVGGYKFYQSNHMKITIGNDLEKAKDDPKKLLEILEKYNNSIKHEKINGKDIEIITYKNDTPLIKMDNKIYTFDFVDESLSEKFKKTNFTNPKEAKNFGKAIVKEFFSILPDSNTTKINGKVINRGNIKIDGEKVIFGKDGEEKLTFNIRDLLNGIGNIVIDESYVKKINEWFRNELSKDIVINGEDTYFYPLKKLSDGKIISLVQIGELDQQKNGK